MVRFSSSSSASLYVQRLGVSNKDCIVGGRDGSSKGVTLDLLYYRSADSLVNLVGSGLVRTRVGVILLRADPRFYTLSALLTKFTSILGTIEGMRVFYFLTVDVPEIFL